MPNLPGPSIPLGSAVACMDCKVVFDTAEAACPKCGSEVGLVPLRSEESFVDLFDETEGVLLTIAKRRLGPSSDLAARMLARVRSIRRRALPTQIRITKIAVS